MFFGGALLAHISLADTVHAVEERLVPIRQLNQRFVVVTDSDKQSHDAALQARVERLRARSGMIGMQYYG